MYASRSWRKKITAFTLDAKISQRGKDVHLCPQAKVHVLYEWPKVLLRCAATSGGLGAQSVTQRAHASAPAAGTVHAGLAR